jgi:regulator of PEP synthase PpsR (kinase-PPPase family)
MIMHRIFAISDATGKTSEGVVRAALTQFVDPEVEIIRYGGVRSSAHIGEIVAEADQSGGFIVHTLVAEELRLAMLTEGRAANVATIDLMGPMLARLSDLLDTPPRSVPGASQPFDSAYLLRIDAINFTVRHDDGQNLHDLEEAEIVLVGVSRTSKTPLSIYLAYRGWRVANVPLMLDVEPPANLFKLPRRKVVGLVVKPERLMELRQVRAEHMGIPSLGYADLEHIRKEVVYSYEIFERRRDWPLVDVTVKPIEEAASEIVTLLGKQSHDKTGSSG